MPQSQPQFASQPQVPHSQPQPLSAHSQSQAQHAAPLPVAARPHVQPAAPSEPQHQVQFAPLPAVGAAPLAQIDASVVSAPQSQAITTSMPKSQPPIVSVAPTQADSSLTPKVRHQLEVHILSARGLRNADWMGKSDPYCIASIPGKPNAKVQTPVIDNCLSPVWNYLGVIPGYSHGDTLDFSVWDKDPPPKSDDLLGVASLDAQAVANGFNGEIQLRDAGKGITAFLSVHVKLAQHV